MNLHNVNRAILPEQDADPVEQSAQEAGRPRILVADDDREIRRVIQ